MGPPAGGRPETDQAGRAADPALPPGRPRKALVRGRRRAGAHRADRPAGGGAWGHLPRSGQCPGEPGGQDVVRWSTAGRQHGPTDPSAPAHADLGFVPVRAHRVGHGLRAGRDHGETVARRGRAAPGRCRRLFPGPHGRALGLRRRRRRADRGRCGCPDDRGQPAGLASAQGRRATGRERRSARAGRRARPGGDRQPALRPRRGGPGGPVGCGAPRPAGRHHQGARRGRRPGEDVRGGGQGRQGHRGVRRRWHRRLGGKDRGPARRTAAGSARRHVQSLRQGRRRRRCAGDPGSRSGGPRHRGRRGHGHPGRRGSVDGAEHGLGGPVSGDGATSGEVAGPDRQAAGRGRRRAAGAARGRPHRGDRRTWAAPPDSGPCSSG